MHDPYWEHGLQRNPFIAEVQPGVADALWLDRGVSLAPVAGGKQFVQLLGDKGAGKTSHLLHWRQQAPGPYWYVPPNWRRWRLPVLAPIVYWDEADRIPQPLLVWALQQAARQPATICAGTHADLSQAATKAGLTVQTIHFQDLQVEALLAWVAMRIRAVQIPGQTSSLVLSADQAAEIIADSGASWRVAAEKLHRWAAVVVQQPLRSSPPAASKIEL